MISSMAPLNELIRPLNGLEAGFPPASNGASDDQRIGIVEQVARPDAALVDAVVPIPVGRHLVDHDTIDEHPQPLGTGIETDGEQGPLSFTGTTTSVVNATVFQ